MVMCSDVNIYVCKYMRSTASAYKLACEFIGAKLADSTISQLTSTDTILWSDLFKHFIQSIDRKTKHWII